MDREEQAGRQDQELRPPGPVPRSDDGARERPVFVGAVGVSIDALNLAYWAGRLPSLRVPLAVAAALLQSGRRPVLFLDATVRHRFPHEPDLVAALAPGGDGIVIAASGVPADRLLLRHARDSGGVILSRDHFRDHRRRFRRLIDDPERRLDGHVAGDRVQVPKLALATALPATTAEALAGWQAARAAAGIP